MTKISYIYLSDALSGKEDLFLETFQKCLNKAVENLSTADFERAFIPEKINSLNYLKKAA